MKLKRISDFPASPAENVEVFARDKDGRNVRVLYDIKQSKGQSTTSTMSQAAITNALDSVVTLKLSETNDKKEYSEVF